jgi:hypothetical protein
MTNSENTGDMWGQWGQPINTGARRVPTFVPITFRLGTRAAHPESCCPHCKGLGTESGDASTLINTGLSPLSPVVPSEKYRGGE